MEPRHIVVVNKQIMNETYLENRCIWEHFGL